MTTNPQSELSSTQVKEMLLLVADRIIAAEPELSQADRDLGDGDHGIGMERGMKAVKEALEAAPDDNTPGDLFSAMGMAMMSSMGGASGAIFGTLFRAGKKALADYPGNFDAKGLAALLPAAAESIMKRGGAKAGDKTMLDALIPAADKAQTVTDLPLSEALNQVADAAEAGRDASKDMIATMGRAKTLGEKSLGLPDAGACSIAIIFRTMADYTSNPA
jgi:dihydroxyacetone kinase-like protein